MSKPNYKDSVRQAMFNNHKRQLKSPAKKRGKNKKPEKDVERSCMSWMNEAGFSMNVVEAKAVYSHSAGRYIKGQTDAGFSDSAGVCSDGIGAFVEFKSKGRLSTLSIIQREFLRTKILKGAFGVVVDCADLLAEIHSGWRKARRQSIGAGTAYLLSKLPKEKEDKDCSEKLFG